MPYTYYKIKNILLGLITLAIITISATYAYQTFSSQTAKNTYDLNFKQAITDCAEKIPDQANSAGSSDPSPNQISLVRDTTEYIKYPAFD